MNCFGAPNAVHGLTGKEEIYSSSPNSHSSTSGHHHRLRVKTPLSTPKSFIRRNLKQEKTLRSAVEEELYRSEEAKEEYGRGLGAVVLFGVFKGEGPRATGHCGFIRFRPLFKLFSDTF